MKRVLVYVAHFSLGARSGPPRVISSGSPSIDADPTTPAANGPKSTAAKTAAIPEIDSSRVRRQADADPFGHSSGHSERQHRQGCFEGVPGENQTEPSPTAATASARTYATVRAFCPPRMDLALSLEWGIRCVCRQFPIEESCLCRESRSPGRSRLILSSPAGVGIPLSGGSAHGNSPALRNGC